MLLTFPAFDGISVFAFLPATGALIPAGTLADELVTNEQPADAPALSGAQRAVQKRTPLAEGARTVVLIFGIAFTQKVVLQSYPAFNIIFPVSFVPVGTAFYLAFYDTSNPSAGWQDPFEGPAVVEQSHVLLFTGLSAPITFAANVRYYFELYATSASATPSPQPIGSPTAAPTGVSEPLTVSPSTLSFTGPGQTLTLTASRPSFTGTFSATATDGLVTVQRTGSSSFAVTSGNASGTTSVAVSDSAGDQLSVPVTITITEATFH